MKTTIVEVAAGLSHRELVELLRPAGALLKADHVVSFPTETVYGLGASAFSDAAIKKVFEAKGRPSDNPLIVHVSSKDMLRDLVDSSRIPPLAHKLMDTFWPGPLTVLLPKLSGGSLSELVTAKQPCVGVRMPKHPVALALIDAAGVPIAAPSANLSGKPSPTSAAHVFADLNGKIPMIVDGGSSSFGLESTVVETFPDSSELVICRPGGVSFTDLERIAGVGNVRYDPAVQVSIKTTDEKASDSAKSDLVPRAPGMKYRHYAPKASLYLIFGSPEFQVRNVHEVVESLLETAKVSKIGILSDEGGLQLLPALEEILKAQKDIMVVQSLGPSLKSEEASARLYASLRYFDDNDVDVIFGFIDSKVGESKGSGYDAVINRLLKASFRVLRQEM